MHVNWGHLFFEGCEEGGTVFVGVLVEPPTGWAHWVGYKQWSASCGC